MAQVKPAIVLLALLSALTGLAYPLLVTGVAQILFPAQANGSLLVEGGRVVGSALVGQSFDDPRFFWGRLSGTGPFPYNAAVSSGSNFGPLSEALLGTARARIEALRAAEPQSTAPIPVDLVTASASGLDPHVSLAAARFQAARVARARGLRLEEVEAAIRAHAEGRQLGFLGEPRVNVLKLNLALERGR